MNRSPSNTGRWLGLPAERRTQVTIPDADQLLLMSAEPAGLTASPLGTIRVAICPNMTLNPQATTMFFANIPLRAGTHGEIMRIVTDPVAVWIWALFDISIDGSRVGPHEVIGHPIGSAFAGSIFNMTMPATGDAITLAPRAFVEICVVNDK